MCPVCLGGTLVGHSQCGVCGELGMTLVVGSAQAVGPFPPDGGAGRSQALLWLLGHAMWLCHIVAPSPAVLPSVSELSRFGLISFPASSAS